MNSVCTMFCDGSQHDVCCKICHKANTVFCRSVNTTSYTIQKHEIFISNQNDFTNNEFLFLLHKNLYIWINFSAFNKIFWKCLVNIHREVLLFVSKIQTWFEKMLAQLLLFDVHKFVPQHIHMWFEIWFKFVLNVSQLVTSFKKVNIKYSTFSCSQN